MTNPKGARPVDTAANHSLALNAFAAQHSSVDAAIHTNGEGDPIKGTSGDDFLLGTDNREHITGLNGNDELVGFGGADTIDGGNGDDILDGGKGGDQLLGRGGHDILLGEQGNDVLVGGAGIDWAYYHDALFSGTDAHSVTVDLSTGTATDRDGGTDTIFSTEDVIGTDQDGDVLTGDSHDNLLSGYAGADTLIGGGGNDFLEGGGGATLVLDGGDGSDTAFIFNNSGEGEKINLTVTDAQNVSSEGTVTLTNIENVNGFYYNDTIIGSAGDNKLYGDLGDDLLRGGNGNDALYGGGYDHGDGDIVTDAYIGGNDTLVGGAGDDILNGGGGADQMSGGPGADTFVFEFTDDSGAKPSDALDHIIDLDNTDTIDLTAIESNYGVTLTEVDALTGTKDKPADTGQFTLTWDKKAGDAGTTYLKVDVNGDGHVDMLVALDGDHRDFDHFAL
jgi:Ca2+-binding RTX toxin-like protein